MVIRSSVFRQIEPLRENTKEEMDGNALIDSVLSWSLQDVLNPDLCENEVKEIPKTFSSMTEYMKSFIHPLIEETRANLCSNMKEVSQAPSCEIDSIKKSKHFKTPKDLFYEITLKATKKIILKKAAEKDVGKYEPEVGDLIALTDVEPKCIEDLNRRFSLIAYVHGAKDIDSGKLKILASKIIFHEQDEHICRRETRLASKKQTLVAVYLMNMTTNIRIWKALNPGPEGGNTSIIEKLLQPSSAGDATCTSCFSDTECSSPMPSSVQDIIRSSNLNGSQEAAVLSCIRMIDCHHQNNIKIIWGPPGTGKTRTVGFLLFAFLKMKCSTLICAPTNVAVLEVAKRLLSLARDSLEYDTYGLGDIVLFGNGKRMKIDDHDDLLDVFLDYRADVLGKCLASRSGLQHCLQSMISLLEHPRFQYERYLEEREKKKNEEGDKLKKDEPCLEKLKKKNSEGGEELERDETNLEIITNKRSEGDDELEQEETNLEKMRNKNTEGDDELEQEETNLEKMRNKSTGGDDELEQEETNLEKMRNKSTEGDDELEQDETNLEKMRNKSTEGDDELEQDEKDLEKMKMKNSEADDEDETYWEKTEKRNKEGDDELEGEESKLKNMKKKNNEGDDELEQDDDELKQHRDDPLTFEEYFKERFCPIHEELKSFMVNLYTHLPTSLVPSEEVEKMIGILALLKSLDTEVLNACVANRGSKQVHNDFQDTQSGVGCFINSSDTRQECLQKLRCLTISIPNFKDNYAIKDFCLANACLVFCTASSSAKLQTQGIRPLEFLVIDEAAQLKECESAIPLQLPGLRHAILIGDERQLPAMVHSELSTNVEFGRSLFERLILLGHQKHLLDVQYRMHPSISSFPNREFYEKKITDAPHVKETDYEKRFLQGDMYSPYSFISVAQGKEDRCWKNTVQAAVVSEIVANLYKRFLETNNKVSVGIISPYNAQVRAIEERVSRYSNADSGFTVSVRSVDGFQGGEEDIIIISTVRCNLSGNVGFLCNERRANVALTRARYCLWVVGSGATLLKRKTVWKKLVRDAEERGCFYDANEDKSLAKAINASLTELEQLEQLEILFNNDSQLFREATWKVRFSDDFKRFITGTKNEAVLSLLRKLSTGWRQPDEKTKPTMHNGTSSEFLEIYTVDLQLNLVWSVDILQEDSDYTQIIMVWDVVPLSDVPELANCLDIVFQSYTEEKVHLCKQRCVERNLVVPKRWPMDSLSESLSSLSLKDESETSTAASSQTIDSTP